MLWTDWLEQQKEVLLKEKTLHLSVRVRPEANKTQWQGWHDEAQEIIRLDIKAPAQGGKANQELERWIAKEFGATGAKVMLGKTSRHKVVRLRIGE